MSGTFEWDLAHFRPKGRVRSWPPAKLKLRYGFATGSAATRGYYLLSYHPRNYGAACKTCNSPFKSDYFPVAAGRVAGKDAPEDYAAEHSFLAYPLGRLDEDPETLIAFTGVQAEPRHARADDEQKWRRGRVMIDFFGLNRDALMEERAWWLRMAVWPNVLLADQGNPEGVENLQTVLSEKSPFTNCARCFVELCRTDRATARTLITQFQEMINSMER